MRTIALDAMGGDNGPEPLVHGALCAAGDGLRLLLVGDRTVLGPLIERHRRVTDGSLSRSQAAVEIIHAAEWIRMDEEPAFAIRAKPQASIRVVMRLLAEGVAQAGVSAGPTGATLAAALLGLGRLGSIRRPAVAGALPVTGFSGGDVILVDAGGSPDVQPRALVDWARLGTAYARSRGTRTPRFGLLNVGTEHGKGNELTRSAEAMLAAWAAAGGSPATFVGNIEPADVLSGRVDVVVTDGFTGNIVIKTLEAAFADRIDAPPGAVIVGVRGTVVVAHAAAGPAEVAGAIATAVTVSDSPWLDDLAEDIT